MSEAPLVSIITVNYNQTGVTCALLKSIRQQDYPHVEVFVVDNASEQDPGIIIESAFSEVRYIRSPKNLGFAGGNNLALKEATGEYVFFINNDAELTTGCLWRLVQLFQKRENLGIVSPLICYYPEKEGQPDLIQYAGMTPVHPITGRNRTIGNKLLDQGQFTEAQPTAYAHGAAMMVSRKALDKAGAMEESFFLYYEELDWCERIRRAGFECWIEPRARVYHKESLTVEKLGASKTFYLTRNRILFMKRNFPGWRYFAFQVFLWLVTVPKNLLFYTLHKEGENRRAFLRALWG